MAEPLFLAIDQGTTSTRTILFDCHGAPVLARQRELPQILPAPGWVEHCAETIWRDTVELVRQALDAAPGPVAAIGITNQRETTVLFQPGGAPLGHAIVWQDRRTADFCAGLRAAGHGPLVAARTGLVLDPYFSASKIRWRLDQDPDLARRAAGGNLLFGTIDCYLLHRLTGGRVHGTDASNASRTALYALDRADWDDELLALFGVPRAMLPAILPSSGVVGATDPALFGRAIPIAGIAGDQQAATIGQGCFAVGQMKATYGTGCFMLANVGAEPPRPSAHGLLGTTLHAWPGSRAFALEGAIFQAGSIVRWLRDKLGLIGGADEVEALARRADPRAEVMLVPAFTGLGAPWWDADARGQLSGLTLDAGAPEIAYAALEAVAFQTRDLVEAMAADSGVTPAALRVDGGMTANDMLMQMIADQLALPVDRPKVAETTALGAAWLAARGVDLPMDSPVGEPPGGLDRRFTPGAGAADRDRRHRLWRAAVERVRTVDRGASNRTP